MTNKKSSNGSIGQNEYSKYRVLEYRIGDNWSFSHEIDDISIRMDYLEGWYGKSEREEIDYSHDKTTYNVRYGEKEIKISFFIGTNINQKFATGSTIESLPLINRQEKHSTSMRLGFSSSISRMEMTQMVKMISHLLELLIGRKADIIQLKMNNAKNNHFGNEEIVESPGEIRIGSMLVYFSDVEGDIFQSILSTWFGNTKI